MKRIFILPVLFIAAVSVSSAQEAAPSNPGRLQVAPARPAAMPAPVPAAEPEVTLIPEQVPQNPKKPADMKADAKSKTEINAEELLERIHFREAQVKALRDPQVQAEWERSEKAKTDLDRREALKRYYKLLHERIVKIDRTVKKTSDTRQAAALHRLDQTRIDPTEPLDPLERAERANRN